jgi:xanthine dehydrogenase accessory factor
MSTLTQEIVNRLESGEDFVLATIISRNGSAPRTAGAQMIVAADGSISGTIGGGLLEAETMLKARDVFTTRCASIKEFHLTGKDAAATDMICGGTQEALIEFMDSSDADLLAAYKAALQCEETRQQGWWITRLSGLDDNAASLPRWFIASDGTITARARTSSTINLMLQLPREDLQSSGRGEPAILMELDKAIINLGAPREPQVVTAGTYRFSIDPLSNYGTVYIFGAGHVSQKLAALTFMVGFRTVVLDDREEFANRSRFPTANEIIVLKDNQTAFEEITLDAESYIVIVTRGHLHDKTILNQALKTGAVYIGMIGSKRKREEVYRALKAEGVNQTRLEAVHSPIGLQIGAESPEEIAVSITAELIQTRVKHLKSRNT